MAYKIGDFTHPKLVYLFINNVCYKEGYHLLCHTERYHLLCHTQSGTTYSATQSGTTYSAIKIYNKLPQLESLVLKMIRQF